MIRTFQSMHLKLLFLSLLISLNASAVENPGIIEIKAYNTKNSEFIFQDSVNYFIVLRNNHYCNNCFLSINDFVSKIKNQFPAQFIAISICDSNSLDRKKSIAETKNLLPDFDEFIVQYSTSTNNIFNQYLIKQTPEILILTNGNVEHISNPEIFEIASVNVSAETKEHIIKLLNGK